MFKKVARITTSLVLLFALFVAAAPTKVDALFEGSKSQACAGLALSSSSASCDDTGSTGGISNIIATALNLLSFVVGVVAVVMIIIGGLKFIMSSGDSNNVTSARNTILYAIVGLIIAALAQIIVKFVLNRI